MESNTVKKNQSVGRLLDIIEVMAESGEPVRINEIADKLEMSSSTVYRFLYTLVDRGYVKKDDENSKYYLTLKLKYYADMLSDNTSISAIVRPFLKSLAEKSGETASLVIKEDNMAVYIDKFDGPNRIIGNLQRIGKRAPLYCTGVGKLFLADMNEEECNETLNLVQPFEKLTPFTIVDQKDILLELDRVRQEKISYDNEECEVGAKCIAAPIRDYSKRVVAAISISGPTTRMTDENLRFLRELLVATCREISQVLGYVS